MEGFKDECLARGVLEIYAWLQSMGGERSVLSNTIEHAKQELLSNGIVLGGGTAAPSRIRLPTTTKNYEARTVESSGWANLHGVGPLTESCEAEIISCLNGELNLKYATCLDEKPVIDRQAGSPDKPKRFVVVGSSHAARLCTELRQLGHSVIEVARPGWRAMPGTVTSMKELLEQKITESGGSMHNDVYVFQLWDNTLHAAWAEDTATIPHTKDSLGKYHVHGDAIIVPVSTQTEIFKTLLPLLRTASNHSSVLVGPLPRYLYVSCCRDQEHVTNLKNNDFRTKMRTE